MINKHISMLIHYCALFLIFLAVILNTFLNTPPLTNGSSGSIYNPIVLLAASLAVIMIIACLLAPYRDKAEDMLKKKTKVLLPTAAFFCCFLLFLISFRCYFDTGWDAETLRTSVFNYLEGRPDLLPGRYFSRYQQNILIFDIYYWIMRILGYFGITLRIVLSWFHAAVNVLTGLLVFSVVLEYSQSYCNAWISYFFYIILIGFSPWFLITYTDSLALIFPVLIIRIYQIAVKEKGRFSFWWIILGVVFCIGFHIKPQASLTGIAVIVISFFEAIDSRNWKLFFIHGGKFLLGFGLFTMVYVNVVKANFPVPINDEWRISYWHYIMMGLNTESDGNFNIEDYEFSNQFETYAERTSANQAVIVYRLKNEYTPVKMIIHFTRKIAYLYSDGTFGWGGEGNFFPDKPINPDTIITPFVSQFIFPDGKYWNQWNGFMQAIWLGILACSLLLINDNKNEYTMNCIKLTVIGLTVFQFLFENRPRYIYTCVPLFIILGSEGISHLQKTIAELHSRKVTED